MKHVSEPLWTLDELGARVVLALSVDYAAGPPGVADNALSSDGSDEPRQGRFWTAAPAGVEREVPPVLIGVPLEPGVTLLLESSRPLDEHDREALGLAAAPLLKFLHA